MNRRDLIYTLLLVVLVVSVTLALIFAADHQWHWPTQKTP